MQTSEYHSRIIDYYRETEFAYKDSWDLDNSLAIHYGYWDEKVRSFPASLARMNEIMAEAAKIKSGEIVLDAGCGIGGSSIFLATNFHAQVTGITLSQRQAEQAEKLASDKQLGHLTDFRVMDYCATSLDDNSIDVVWACESSCYADDKQKFIKEAWRVLKPGGRLVVADGFVTHEDHNSNRIIRNWLEGWQVNYLETPSRFRYFMQVAGFSDVKYRDITKYTLHSARRLKRIYYLASLYLLWKKLTFSANATQVQKNNIRACKYQYTGMKRGLWEYGLITGKKEHT
jgi:tocopherol O-methyltransferase